jgi:hypothetical protein
VTAAEFDSAVATLRPRPDRPPAPVKTDAQAGPREIALTARGDLADPEALPSGYRMVPRGYPTD